jgi:hypothetical protein
MDSTGRRFCGAKKKDGTPCRALARANGRCRIHGGNSVQGIASGTYKHGRYSQYMPEAIGTLAYQAANDSELFNLRELIGVYDARIKSALQELEEGGGLNRMKAIRDAWDEFKEAIDAMDRGVRFTKAELDARLRKVDSLIRASGHDFYLWMDVDVAAINLKKLMESERKRQIEMHALIPTVKAQDFARNVIMVVRSHVTDQGQLTRIQQDLEQLIGGYPALLAEVEGEVVG